jgi:small-conductance mechanosensitive channel
MSERVRTAIITGAVGIVVIVGVRLAMEAAFKGYLARVHDKRTPGEIAGQKTRFVILRRLVTAILVAIVGWSILQEFPATNALARSLLASTAVITIFIGIALSGPLSNIGAGVLLGWSQSVRLGDRVTISDVTGKVEEITLMQTVLITDEGRRVFVPNSQMASSIVTNRSFDDPRRLVTVRLPIRIAMPVEQARTAILGSLEGFGEGRAADANVVVDNVTESATWLSVSVRLPPGSEVAPVAAELRERSLSALGSAKLLPGQAAE